MALPDTHARRRLVGVSTKMYFSAARTTSYVASLLSQIAQSPDLLTSVDVFVIPDHVMLLSVIQQLQGTGIMAGAQDAYSDNFGAFTGEVSPAVLAEVGTRIVELGHAERRRLFGETDETTALKAAAAARNGMMPLICIGERTEGEVQIAVNECKSQVDAVMSSVPDDAEVVLAYEPVWAIGAAEPAPAEYVVEVTKQIRQFESITSRKGLTRILYGGSAGPGLFEKLKEGVDGLFLGRFAHDPMQFIKTIEEISEA